MTAGGERYAWLIVGVCTAMVTMAFGAINNISVFLLPLAAEFGWPRADVALAYSIATIATGAGGVLMGYFADRMPVRRVALCGALVSGLALVFLSRLETTRELYVLHALLGFAGVGAILAPLNSLASLWLARKPGLAIGIVSAGGALGQGVIPYLARHLVLVEGWRQAYLILGLSYLMLLVPLALLLRDAPGPASPAGGSGASFARASPGRLHLLALLSAAALLCCVCMATPLVHVANLGSDLGISAGGAAGLLAVMAACALAGRIGFGQIADRIGSLRTYIAASLGQTLLTFLFPYASTRGELYALSAIFGLVFSGAMTAFLACAREYAPAGRTGVAIGGVMLFAWLGMALGGWQGGFFYDLCGDYYRAFANASIVGALNLLVLAVLYVYTLGNPLTLGRMKWQSN